VLGIDSRVLRELRDAYGGVRLRECGQHHVEKQRRGQRVNASLEAGSDAGLVKFLLHRTARRVEEGTRDLRARPRVDAAERFVPEGHAVEQTDDRLHGGTDTACLDQRTDDVRRRSSLVRERRIGVKRAAGSAPGGAELCSHDLQERQRVVTSGSVSPRDEHAEQFVAAFHGNRGERPGADLEAQRRALARREVGDEAHERCREVAGGRRRPPRGSGVDARDRAGANVQGRQRLAEDGLDTRERLGLDSIGNQPDTVTIELGEVAAKPEVAQTSPGELEQLIACLGAGHAPAQLRERSQRTARRVRVRVLLLHLVAGSDAPAADPMTSLSQGVINRRPACGITFWPEHRANCDGPRYYPVTAWDGIASHWS
jgi:hypothetical protein